MQVADLDVGVVGLPVRRRELVVAPFVTDDVVFREGDFNVFMIAAARISGGKAQVARARAAIASRLTSTAVYRTTSAEAQGIEQRLEESGRVEVESSWLGEQVMTELQAVDEVAYVRFASVYRQFKDVTEFMEELRGLREPGEE